MQPDNPDYYQHFHPLEDLLKFLEDPSANDDPVDQTIGGSFTFRVYSRRWKREDQYRIKRTADGWEVAHIAINGPCDKGGKPFLFRNFDQDSIQYPAGLAGWLEWLWTRASEDGLSKDAVQQAINQLAAWVSATEKGSPQGGVWKGY
ncbi:MAG: hypothetical protein WCO56_02170 [Verrucomicrobiota bacterium]